MRNEAIIAAYAHVFAAAHAAVLDAQQPNNKDGKAARIAAMRCVNTFRDEVIMTFPECGGNEPAIPDNIATNPEAGTF